jgi:hypothetical protein
MLHIGGVGADSTHGGCTQHPRVGADSTTKQEVKPVIETTTIRASRFDPISHLLSLEVDGQVVEDWLALRKSKKLPATKTAFDGVQKEALKAKFSMDEAIRECCSRGWGSFKADWVLDTQDKRTAARVDAWWATNETMSAKARDLGISDARVGEPQASFKARIQQAIDRRRA